MIKQVPKATSFKKAVIEVSHDISSAMFYGKQSNEKMKNYLLAEKIMSYVSYYAHCVEEGCKPEKDLLEYIA